MKRWIVMGMVLVLALNLCAQAPEMFRYQGRLADGTNLVNATLPMSFKLYDAQSGGNPLYEDSNSVLVVDGLYSTYIGDNTVYGSLTNAMTNATVYLELTVNGKTLSPRERLVSVPYSLSASEAGLPTAINRIAGLEGQTDKWNTACSMATNNAAALALKLDATGANITNFSAGLFRTNIDVYSKAEVYNKTQTDSLLVSNSIPPLSSTFAGLRFWASTPKRTDEAIGIIGDSTGYDWAFPKVLYNMMITNFPEVTVRRYQWNGPTNTMILMEERVVSNDSYTVSWSNSTIYTYFTGYENTNEFDMAVRLTFSKIGQESYYITPTLAVPENFNGAMRILANKNVYFTYCTNGGNNSVSGTATVPFTNGMTAWFRTTAHPSSTDGKSEFNFYYSLSSSPTGWVAIGSTVTNTRGAFRNSGTIFLADAANNTNETGYKNVVWRDGVNGQIRSPALSSWTHSVSANVTETGGSPAPVFEIWNGSWPGATSTNWNSQYIAIALPPTLNTVIINSGLNDYYLNSSYSGVYDRLAALARNIRTRCPSAQLCVLSQNPWSTTDFRLPVGAKIAKYQMMAAEAQGMMPIDTYSKYIQSGWNDSWLVDVVHPTFAAHQTEGSYIYNALFGTNCVPSNIITTNSSATDVASAVSNILQYLNIKAK